LVIQVDLRFGVHIGSCDVHLITRSDPSRRSNCLGYIIFQVATSIFLLFLSHQLSRRLQDLFDWCSNLYDALYQHFHPFFGTTSWRYETLFHLPQEGGACGTAVAIKNSWASLSCVRLTEDVRPMMDSTIPIDQYSFLRVASYIQFNVLHMFIRVLSVGIALDLGGGVLLW